MTVGICGRLEAQRNPSLFATVAEGLRDEVQMVWIGAAPGNLPPNVHCTGWLEYSKALAQLAGLDIYLQTSLWEGLSYAVLEAMAMGKPVVVMDIPSNRAIVEHGVTGFVGSNAAELVACIRQLAGDAALRQRMGAAARRYIEEKHDAAKNYLAYGQLYHSLCGA